MTTTSARTTAASRHFDGNDRMEPYEDPELSAQERTDDLLQRLSLEEKIGLLFHTVIEIGPDGDLLEEPGAISKSPTTEVVRERFINHFNVHRINSAREAARWNNALQRLAAQTPHGIPVTISTDPRHAFVDNVGASFTAGPFSQWPDTLGMAALRDSATVREFAEIARDEYRAVGISMALHPQVDLASEPRWTRQLQSFGADPDLAVDYTTAYLEGFQGPALDATSVACVTKHFPGAGPQKDGEDAHFPYGREQVYPADAFGVHLRPFEAALRNGTAAIMPYYGMPVGLEIDGEPIEEVGFGYNKQILTGLLREKLGFEGVILTDWELVNDNIVGDRVLPARAWGVEHLDARQRMVKIIEAGADQFGGEQCTDLLLDLVHDGSISEARIDESARRLLLVKFQLGLFDNPFVDEDAAAEHVGNAESRRAGLDAQSRSVVVLKNGRSESAPVLPVLPGMRVYSEGIDVSALAQVGTPVAELEDADIAIIRIEAPYEPRDDLFLESYFHQGSLEMRPGLVHHLRTIAETTPLILDVALDRPALLAPVVDALAGLTVTFGVSDEALLAALAGRVTPSGRLPVEIPRSMEAIRLSAPDAPSSTWDPLFPIGFGLDLH
ncbi:glycoside hydrolase family 3 N-terminal domain-containing protein [Clavibacter michiganensis]|uniref:glycoside hydrolase family 3 protein n=1 Tax=Clavibacter michiganensis TaxID=28447 RepID=UPI0026DC02E7|nr:glycoside hydrolase family 3 N-terminal domain-containing protein [Clavibacter michiganensis]MDO4036146.1 glycoside hydrolase family 3 N-terminal domain-containing protein [Clavibacter michiganensis]MDO4048947.1 glycoside hydrolase family 3 N-terminal domain-containing protein [Clavibacter michiganensis]MDO4106647.1 glycoside hydrolase family 3 N-terminal domain-containing protein [Clavibacter michiganensis]